MGFCLAIFIFKNICANINWGKIWPANNLHFSFVTKLLKEQIVTGNGLEQSPSDFPLFIISDITS